MEYKLAYEASKVGTHLGGLPGGKPYTRIKPHIFGPRHDWIENLRLAREKEVVQPKDCDVYIFEGASSFFTLLMDREGNIIKESLMNRENDYSFLHLQRTEISDKFLMEDAFPREAEIIRNGTWVFLPMTWDVNYGHWLVEVLSRLSTLKDVVDVTAVNFLINQQSDGMKKVCVDTLGYHGVKKDQIFSISGKRELYEKVILATPITEQPWVKAPLAVRSLENLVGRIPPNKAGPEKIFINRSSQSRRTLSNKSEIANLFQCKGYVLVDPGTLTFEQQIISFRCATHIVGILGAECTNLVFAPRGVRFLGFAPDAMQDDFFWDLVSHKSGEYYCLHGESLDKAASMNSPFSIEIESLKIIMNTFDAS